MRRRDFLQVGVTSAAAAAVGCSPALVCKPRAPNAAQSQFDGKVEHFIVLMMENRSYDQMLGGLRGAQYEGVPAETRLPYDDRDGSLRWIPVRHGAPPDRFSPDPGHGFKAVHEQIYGRGTYDADMTGFARRFLKDHPSVTPKQLEDYFTVYADGALPILHALAKEYGVCTHWFCSLPSSTTPNRMFAHAGTSCGATGQGAFYTRIENKMIFDKLDVKDWRVYFHDIPHLWLTGDAWMQTFCGQFQHFGAFERDVRADRLATYTFIEPQHIVPPWSSQHPSAGESHGEKLIASVYNALVSNPGVFEKSLLLIVYDEHGGFYDHVIPPGHKGWNENHPDISHEVVAPDEAAGDANGHEAPYGFTTLGPRVPAVVVSPWVEKGSVFGWRSSDSASRTTFDHTSILATVGAMTGVWVDSKRARAATTLEATVNRATPRTDYLRTLVFQKDDYLRDSVVDDTDLPDATECHGVAAELCDAFRAAHADAGPSDVVEHFNKLMNR